MIHLFFISYNFSGVKTYASELIPCLRQKDELIVYEIDINAENIEFELEDVSDISASGIGWILRIPRLHKMVYAGGNYMQINRVPPLDILNHWLKPLKDERIIFHCNNEECIHSIEKLRRRVDFKLISTIHFLPKHCYWEKLDDYTEVITESGRELFNELMNKSDSVICVTEFARKHLIRNNAEYAEKFNTIYNGNSRICLESTICRGDYGFTEDDILILFIGRIEPNKGVVNLIHAFKKLNKRYSNLKLILVGDGNHMAIKPLFKESEKDITLMRKQSREIVFKLYQLSDIGVIPSKSEQCSYVALEMMSNKLPIVATKTPGFEELFIDNETALMVDVARGYDEDGLLDIIIDDKMLEDKVESLINSRSLRSNLADNGYKRWQNMFNSHIMSDKTFDTYENLIAHIK